MKGLSPCQATWWLKKFLQELKCYFCYSGILAGMPACQGHILPADDRVKGLGPCTKVRDRVPIQGTAKAICFQERKNKVFYNQLYFKAVFLEECVCVWEREFLNIWNILCLFPAENRSHHDCRCPVSPWGGVCALESDTWPQIPALPIISGMILGTSFNCSMTWCI